ncbi:hypothetical protein JCM10450v2_000110 [Rhodotorula kratochvilovae]
MFSWLFGRPAPVSTSSSAAPASPSSTAPPSRSVSPHPAPADEDEARAARLRKKRQQKKKAQRQKRRSEVNAIVRGRADGDDEEDDDDDDREPDDDALELPEGDAPDADEDLGYLERIGGLRRQREEQAAAAAAAGAAGAPGTAAPVDPIARPGEGALDTRGVVAGPEEVEAAALVGEMLRQGKIRAGPTGPLNRISGLPAGAGQVGGIEVPSTHDVRKKAKENGLIPFTDEKGMLRIGVRVAPDVVLMHPKDGKGEPILLRM